MITDFKRNFSVQQNATCKFLWNLYHKIKSDHLCIVKACIIFGHKHGYYWSCPPTKRCFLYSFYSSRCCSSCSAGSSRAKGTGIIMVNIIKYIDSVGVNTKIMSEFYMLSKQTLPSTYGCIGNPQKQATACICINY